MECYVEVLRAIVAEIKIHAAVEKIDEKIRPAQALPFTDSPEEANRLRDALLR
jgi:hypothetical protein